MDLQPDWQQRETETWQRLHAGEMPIFAAGYLLNRSLVSLFFLPALANMAQVDPRKRAAIFAYSGTPGCRDPLVSAQSAWIPLPF